jgi:AraC-like DNA-binding protein
MDEMRLRDVFCEARKNAGRSSVCRECHHRPQAIVREVNIMSGIQPVTPPTVADHFFYPPVGRLERQWDLYVEGTGYGTWPSELDPVWHPQPYYYHWTTGRVLNGLSLAYVTAGRGELESEEAGRHEVAAGSVFVTFPGIWHRYRALPGTQWSYHWVHFNGGYVKHLLQAELLTRRRPVLQTGIRDTLLKPFWRLVQFAGTQPPGYRQSLAAGAMEITGIALALTANATESQVAHPLVEQARRILEQRVEEVLDLRDLAGSLGVSYHYFRELFKREMGVPPYQYHLARRLERSQTLLIQTAMTVNEIAIALHFHDAYHFSRLFKAKTGHSPTEWRRAARAPDRPAARIGTEVVGTPRLKRRNST